MGDSEPAPRRETGHPMTGRLAALFGPRQTPYASPLSILATIAITIFVAELFIMAVLDLLRPASRLGAALIDAVLLIVLIAPALYLFLFRPLVRHIGERRRAEERLDYQDSHDTLTGLANGALFNERLHQALAAAARDRCLVAVLFADIDRLKLVNESLGRASGDQVLKAVAERWVGSLRGSDGVFRLDPHEGATVARLGGDEFVVLLPRISTVEDVAAVARRLLRGAAEPITVDEHPLIVTSSIGISVFPNDGDTADVLLRNAATAMHRIKGTGGNSVQFHSPEFNARALERLTMETALRQALDRDQFLVYYQPQVELGSDTIIGMEALIRWQHPQFGMVSPAQFIPVAEETGLIVSIGEWVLRTACRQHAAWRAARLPPVRVAVNLSARQFQDPRLVEMVRGVIQDTGLLSSEVELELTESILQDAERAVGILHDLADMGLQLSIDDFGTGYSSLSYLKRFPIHRLKIDQSFVRHLPSSREDAAIVNAIITLAHALGLHVLAEGVERQDQAGFLRSHRCDAAQGYLFSKPLPADEATKLLAEHSQARGRLAA